MSIQEVIARYDCRDFKNYDEHDLNSELHRVPGLDQEKMKVEELAELMAFGFCEDYPDTKTGWGTYFGPMRVVANGDGTASKSPLYDLLTLKCRIIGSKGQNQVSIQF